MAENKEIKKLRERIGRCLADGVAKQDILDMVLFSFDRAVVLSRQDGLKMVIDRISGSLNTIGNFDRQRVGISLSEEFYDLERQSMIVGDLGLAVGDLGVSACKNARELRDFI